MAIAICLRSVIHIEWKGVNITLQCSSSSLYSIVVLCLIFVFFILNKWMNYFSKFLAFVSSGCHFTCRHYTPLLFLFSTLHRGPIVSAVISLRFYCLVIKIFCCLLSGILFLIYIHIHVYFPRTYFLCMYVYVCL